MTAPAKPALRPDTTLRGVYQVVRGLAEGGMGEVYLGRHLRLGCPVAIKILCARFLGDEAARARFALEASVLSQLHHPHVVRLLDFDDTEEGAPYLVMEYLDGATLSDQVARLGPLPPRRASHLVSQIASALAAAHNRGIVHRDLKPANVIVLPHPAPGSFVKVFDFGICRPLGQTTPDATVVGTPEYMAPEQVQNRTIDGRADQFALGALTFSLLTGRPPFRSEDPMSTLYQVVHQETPPLEGPVAGRAPAVEAVLRRALEKAPDQRYPDVMSFADALAAAARESEPPPRPRPERPVRLAPIESGSADEDCRLEWLWMDRW